MWRTQQSQSHVMKATEVEVILSVRMMETGHLHVSLAVQVSLTYMYCILTYMYIYIAKTYLLACKC